MNDQQLVASWSRAIEIVAVRNVLEAVYDYAAEAIAQRGPVCNTSGKCCRFEEYGHLLYVTGLEVAYTANRLSDDSPDLIRDTLQIVSDEGRCPFQIDNLCSVHPLRPLGCRVYFCDPVAHGWQEVLSEKLLDQVKDLHEAHAIPYRYGEWRSMLRLFTETKENPIP